ncbi:aminoglycoside phosphotransferase family protein [Aestuariimicrobium kwangyangense]|uniref:aminoglycoside phosphotransferase family protein n=1 Tax=Aestuariimicrobium kwangyangense TaxID=396389 RepID=UPI0003B3F654|nr:aminoglycoside phosphotransferase family protein [Aestuariimicrobium kwangyangense]
MAQGVTPADVAHRHGVVLDDHPLLPGSMSGSTVVTGVRDGQAVVVKITVHDSDEATGRARREFAALTGLDLPIPMPRVLASEVTAEHTVVVMRAHRPALTPEHPVPSLSLWTSLVGLLARLHATPMPLDAPSDSLWRYQGWSGLDPVADRPALDLLWSTPQTRSKLQRVLDDRDGLELLASAGEEEFVHGDCHWGNVVTDNGDPLLVDWQSAGIGRGTDDLAFLLTRAAANLDVVPRTTVIADYAARRGLDPAEVEARVTARQLLVLALQYPAFVAYLHPRAVERLHTLFVQLRHRPR